MSFLIFDTETSGLPKKYYNFEDVKMLEIGYIILDNEFKKVKENNFLIKTDIEVPEIITKLTGITKELLDEKGENIEYILSNFYNDIKNVDIIMAHNNKFDLGILRQEFININKGDIFDNYIYKKINLDTLDIFKKYINKDEIENFKLQTIYKYYNIENFIQTHRALDDCNMLYSSLVYLKNNNEFNPYKYYIEKPFNFKKYPKMNLKTIYCRDKYYVKNFLKNLRISSYIKNFF